MASSVIDQVVSLKDKHGDIFTLSPAPYGKHHEALLVLSRVVCVLDVKNETGVKVGLINYRVENDRPWVVYLNWVSLSSTVRGRGYIIAMAKYANAFFPEAGVRELVLAVPAEARSVYESFGFVEDTSIPSLYGRIQMQRHFD